MPLIEIKEVSADQEGFFYRLTDAQLRSRQEPEKGIFIAEGPRVIHTALDAGYTPLSLMMRRKFIDGLGREIIDKCGDIPVFTGDDEDLAEWTGFQLQRSWALCAMKRPPAKSVEEVIRDAQRVVVLEGINEPSNVGAIFRSAAALGTDAVLLTPICCDPLHRRSVRVCMGSIFMVPWAWTSENEGFPALKENGFLTVGMALKENSIGLDDPELVNAPKVAIYLGTEDSGLTDETIRRCDRIVKIPMAHNIDSLNVAAAAAVAMWELRIRD